MKNLSVVEEKIQFCYSAIFFRVTFFCNFGQFFDLLGIAVVFHLFLLLPYLIISNRQSICRLFQLNHSFLLPNFESFLYQNSLYFQFRWTPQEGRFQSVSADDLRVSCFAFYAPSLWHALVSKKKPRRMLELDRKKWNTQKPSQN